MDENVRRGEAQIFQTTPIERVQEGMRVVDQAGEELGTVDLVKMGDPEAVTTQGSETGDTGLVGKVASAVFGPEPDVPEPIRQQLLRSGFIRIDAPGLTGADRYVSADQIGEVSGDTVRLRVRKDQIATGG